MRSGWIVIAVLMQVATGAAWSAEQTVADAIAAFVKKARPSAEVRVESVTHLGRIPPAALERVVMTAGTIPGRASFSLRFRDGSRIYATAVVRLSERVIMPKRAFSKGHILREEDVYEAFIDLLRTPRDAVSEISDAIGRPLARSIVPGAPITKDMVFETSVVRSGASVTLVCEGPNFVIRTTGEIKQRGVVGEYVKVMNRSSKKILTGLLLDEATVKVEL